MEERKAQQERGQVLCVIVDVNARPALFFARWELDLPLRLRNAQGLADHESSGQDEQQDQWMQCKRPHLPLTAV